MENKKIIINDTNNEMQKNDPAVIENISEKIFQSFMLFIGIIYIYFGIDVLKENIDGSFSTWEYLIGIIIFFSGMLNLLYFKKSIKTNKFVLINSIIDVLFPIFLLLIYYKLDFSNITLAFFIGIWISVKGISLIFEYKNMNKRNILARIILTSLGFCLILSSFIPFINIYSRQLFGITFITLGTIIFINSMIKSENKNKFIGLMISLLVSLISAIFIFSAIFSIFMFIFGFFMVGY